MARSGILGVFFDSDSLNELVKEFLDGVEERLWDEGPNGDDGIGIGGTRDEGAGCLGKYSCLSRV